LTMARIPPKTASPSQDWLLRATRKLEKSIYRSVEYKYRNVIVGLNAHITCLKARITELEEYQSDIDRLEDELTTEISKVEDLEAKLRVYERPNVAVKDIQEEIFRVKTVNEQRLEATKKTKDIVKEIDNIKELKDAPPSKILEIGPLPRSLPILQIPEVKRKKRERSLSPKSTNSRLIRKKNSQEKEQNISQSIDPSPPPLTLTSVLATTPPAVPPLVKSKKRKRKKKEEN